MTATSVAPRSLKTVPAVATSTIGQKVIMAVSGVVLIGFLILHMAGNLKVFTGREHFDDYAFALRDFGGAFLGHEWFLWTMRTGLIIAVLAHIWAATSLTVRASNARPIDYAGPVKRVQATYASRTMRWGGVMILLFVIYHLLHMTTGTVHPEFEHGAVYDNTVAGFKVWYVSVAYMVAMLAVGLHLYHGLWSIFQTLGRNRPNWDPVLRRLAQGGATAITVGFVSVPIAVLAGIVH